MRERYIITKPSDDGTFEVGDRIIFEDNGDISCIEAQGWIKAADVRDVMCGAEYEIDRAYRDRRIQALREELAQMESGR
jgi:hypothetical protein